MFCLYHEWIWSYGFQTLKTPRPRRPFGKLTQPFRTLKIKSLNLTSFLLKYVHSRKLTWNSKMEVWFRWFSFSTGVICFRCKMLGFGGVIPKSLQRWVIGWVSRKISLPFAVVTKTPHNPLKHPTKTTNLEPCFQSTFNIRLWRPFHGGTQGGGTFFRAMINGCEFGYTGGMVRWRAHECCEFGAVLVASVKIW